MQRATSPFRFRTSLTFACTLVLCLSAGCSVFDQDAALRMDASTDAYAEAPDASLDAGTAPSTDASLDTSVDPGTDASGMGPLDGATCDDVCP